MAALLAYDWPGNVRELRTVAERARALLVLGETPSPGIMRHGATHPDALAGAPSAFHKAKDIVVSNWERRYLQHLLARARGNVSLAARHARISRSHLRGLLGKHGFAH
jgi:DNA-binding NtrC family response regulator